MFTYPFGPKKPEKACPYMKQSVFEREVSEDSSLRNFFLQEMWPCKLKGWATQRKSAAVFPYVRETKPDREVVLL